MGLTTLTLEETGKSCHFTAGGVPFRVLYSVSPTPPYKRKAPEEICEENNKTTGAAGCGREDLPGPAASLYCCFLDTKTKAFKLLILKSTFSSTSINLQNLKRAPVSSSKRGGFRALTGRRGVFKPLTAKPDIS